MWPQGGQAQSATDPFVDYSEYDNSASEEADINFFRNGRFLSLALNVGYRITTHNMRRMYRDSLAYGLFFNYFFNLNFAMQLHFYTGSLPIRLEYKKRNGSTSTVTGSSLIYQMGGGLKFYFNTANVTRGLAWINPYLYAGASQNIRQSKLSGDEMYARDGAPSLDAGLGIEFPLNRNRMFIGVQGLYHFVTFSDESRPLEFGDGKIRTGFYPKGDWVSVLGTLGINF